MAQIRHFTYPSADGVTQIHAMEWRPDEGTQLRGILQIAHGMQEFIERYNDFAIYMAQQGFLVVGNDHLGHGDSVQGGNRNYWGYFAKEQGNRLVLQDMRTLQSRTADAHPDVPYFLLGHSMGSFLARQYLCVYGRSLAGAVISGTASHSALECAAGKTLCRLLARRHGWFYRSTFINNLSIGSCNRKFEPARTPCDWLTRDEKIVDAYIADPRTQFIFTLNGFYGLFESLSYLTKTENLRKMPKKLPVFFIAGQMDPVGNFGEGPRKVAARFQGLGLKAVTCRIYPLDRHEVLNELDKTDVWKDVKAFLEGCL